MKKNLSLNIELSHINVLTGFPGDQELFSIFEEDLRAEVPGITSVAAMALPGATSLMLSGSLKDLRSACKFMVESCWLPTDVIDPALDQLADKILSPGGVVAGRSNKDLSWARKRRHTPKKS